MVLVISPQMIIRQSLYQKRNIFWKKIDFRNFGPIFDILTILTNLRPNTNFRRSTCWVYIIIIRTYFYLYITGINFLFPTSGQQRCQGHSNMAIFHENAPKLIIAIKWLSFDIFSSNLATKCISVIRKQKVKKIPNLGPILHFRVFG